MSNLPVVGALLEPFLDGPVFDPDWMMHTGCITFFAAVLLSSKLELQMDYAIETMQANGTLSGNDEQLQKLRNSRRELSRRLAKIGAVVVALAELAVVVLAVIAIPVFVCGWNLLPTFNDQLLFAVMAGAFTVAASCAGYFLGNLNGFGAFFRLAKEADCVILLSQSKSDGYAGLKDLSKMLSRQGLASLIPIFWLSGWLIAMSFPAFDPYGIWRIPFAGLLVLAIYYGWNGFFRPRRDMETYFIPAFEFAREEGNTVAIKGLTRLRRRLLPPNVFLVLVGVLLVAIIITPLLTGITENTSLWRLWTCGL
ncbi:MAG: hypothetical protein AAFQ04_08840 [Pseudomonadota bacterium]